MSFFINLDIKSLTFLEYSRIIQDPVLNEAVYFVCMLHSISVIWVLVELSNNYFWPSLIMNENALYITVFVSDEVEVLLVPATT